MPKSNIQTNLLSPNPDFTQGHVFISLPRGAQTSDLSAGGGRQIKALLQGEFTIGGSNQFNTPLASAALESLSEKLNVLKGTVTGLANLAGTSVNLGSQVRLGNLNQTANFWTGSERPTFNIDLLFVALRRSDDVRTQVEPLYQTVFASGSNILSVDAPLGYSTDPSGKNATGTFAIQLGSWFRATRQVMTSVSFTYSQEMIPLDGTVNGTEPTKFAPLFARGSISFQPYRDITYKEFQGYFLK